jgi:hypothetical protein
MDGIGLAGRYWCRPTKIGRWRRSTLLVRRVLDFPPQGFFPRNLSTNSRYEAFPVLPVNRVFLAPARPRPAALFAVGVLHAQSVTNHTTTTATNTVKLPEPVTLLRFDEGTGTYAAASVGDHPAPLIGQAGWSTGVSRALLAESSRSCWQLRRYHFYRC